MGGSDAGIVIGVLGSPRVERDGAASPVRHTQGDRAPRLPGGDRSPAAPGVPRGPLVAGCGRDPRSIRAAPHPLRREAGSRRWRPPRHPRRARARRRAWHRRSTSAGSSRAWRPTTSTRSPPRPRSGVEISSPASRCATARRSTSGRRARPSGCGGSWRRRPARLVELPRRERSDRRRPRPCRTVARPRPAPRTGAPGPHAAARRAGRPCRGGPPVSAVRPDGRRGARRRATRRDDGAVRGDRRRRGRRAGPGRRAPVSPSGRARYPFTGRDAEVAALEAAIGPGRVVVVEGEPGVGKTRLVEEVLAARERRPLLMVRCYDNDGDVPYGPLVELLRLAVADPAAAAVSAALPRSCARRGGPAGAGARTGRRGRLARTRAQAPTPDSSTASRERCWQPGARPRGPRGRRRPVGRRRQPAGAGAPRAPSR